MSWSGHLVWSLDCLLALDCGPSQLLALGTGDTEYHWPLFLTLCKERFGGGGVKDLISQFYIISTMIFYTFNFCVECLHVTHRRHCLDLNQNYSHVSVHRICHVLYFSSCSRTSFPGGKAWFFSKRGLAGLEAGSSVDESLSTHFSPNFTSSFSLIDSVQIQFPYR